MPQFQLTINARSRAIDVDDPSTPLLWVLRDVIGLTGTKYGCGIGQCGACSVHLNGAVVRSCSISIADAAGSAITTIEGLSPDGRHPLQVAWQEEDVPQCGYCQAGQLMTAAAFLAANATPTDEQIVAAMSGNLCRCGTYPRIHRAIKRAVSRSRT